MPVKLSCQVCGSDFSVKPYREDSAKYCSKSCQHKSLEKDFITKSCDGCGETFDVKPSRSDTARFCSIECYNSERHKIVSGEDAPGWKGGRIIDTHCKWCNNKFKIYKSRENTARFCSPNCRHQYLSDKLSKSSTDIRRSAEYRKWRRAVKKRDGECVECGSTKNLHAHHIIPVGEDESLATNIENGKTLCTRCHAEKHPEIAELINPKG